MILEQGMTHTGFPNPKFKDFNIKCKAKETRVRRIDQMPRKNKCYFQQKSAKA